MPTAACRRRHAARHRRRQHQRRRSRCMTAASWRGIWRIATEPQRTSDEYAVWLLTLLGHAGLKRDRRSSARGDRHRGAGGALSPAPAVPRLVQVEPLVARVRPRLGLRDQGRQPRRGRRRPAAQRAGRRIAVRRPAGGDRFRHRDHVRRGRRATAPISAASSRPASTCRSRRCTRPPPGCRASASAGRRR